VSHQALSERLRRGVGSLIESTIVDHWVGQDGPRDPDSDATGDTGVTSRKTPIERSVALSL
jgi:hypothetical protein